MIGIGAIASHVPEAFEANADKKEIFGVDDVFLTDKIGVGRVTRMRPGEDTSDLCVKAFHALQAKTGLAPADIDCVILCTQNPDGHGIPHSSAVIHGKLGLGEDCASFDISLGCSGYVYGLSVAMSFMQTNGLHTGLLFTCDPYSKIVDAEDKNTALLFGDAATVSLIAPAEVGATAWVPRGFRYLTRGRDGHALANTTGKLSMNGRAVFSFSATAVPVQIESLLKDAGIPLSEIDLFLFHQGSKYILDTLRRRMALTEEKVPMKLFKQGNTVSSSIPLLFEDHYRRDELRRVVLSGFGVGLSAASCLLERWRG